MYARRLRSLFLPPHLTSTSLVPKIRVTYRFTAARYTTTTTTFFLYFLLSYRRTRGRTVLALLSRRAAIFYFNQIRLIYNLHIFHILN